MKFIDLVKKRTSCRNYENIPIKRELIDTCLEAARLSPSACNSQPWSFIVIDDPALLKSIYKNAFCGIYSMNSFVAKAPVLVLIITEKSRYTARLGSLLKGTKYNLIDVGIACEHFILQATELNIGTCWIGWFSEKGIKKALNLNKNVHIDAIISCGYPAEIQNKRSNRKSLNEIRTYNSK